MTVAMRTNTRAGSSVYICENYEKFVFTRYYNQMQYPNQTCYHVSSSINLFALGEFHNTSLTK